MTLSEFGTSDLVVRDVYVGLCLELHLLHNLGPANGSVVVTLVTRQSDCALFVGNCYQGRPKSHRGLQYQFWTPADVKPRKHHYIMVDLGLLYVLSSLQHRLVYAGRKLELEEYIFV